MAKLERQINCNFNELLSHIEDGILNGSVSASLEDSSFFKCEGAKCAVRIFERYSYFGQNRVSLSVTLFQATESSPVFVSAVTSGGSQAMFFKINTFGEEAFLKKLSEIIDQKTASL